MVERPGGPEWWVSGRKGNLSPWSQAKVFALWRVSEKKKLDLTDGDIAAEVEKIGGGTPSENTIRFPLSFLCDPGAALKQNTPVDPWPRQTRARPEQDRQGYQTIPIQNFQARRPRAKTRQDQGPEMRTDISNSWALG